MVRIVHWKCIVILLNLALELLLTFIKFELFCTLFYLFASLNLKTLSTTFCTTRVRFYNQLKKLLFDWKVLFLFLSFFFYLKKISVLLWGLPALLIFFYIYWKSWQHTLSKVWEMRHGPIGSHSFLFSLCLNIITGIHFPVQCFKPLHYLRHVGHARYIGCLGI